MIRDSLRNVCGRALGVAALVVLGSSTGCPSGNEATLYRGGPILTMDATNRIVDALAIEGERIAAVGSGVLADRMHDRAR